MIGTTWCATRGGGGVNTPYNGLYGKAPSLVSGLFPQKMGGVTHFFLKEKPSGRGWKAYLFESSGIYRKGQGFHKLKHMKEVTGVVYGCKKSKPMVLYIRYLKVM